MQIKTLLKKGLLLGLLTLLCSLIFSFFVGEFVVKHMLPQDTYQIARSVGLHIFEENPTIPFTLQKGVKDFHHIGYTHEFDHYVSTNSWGLRGKELKKEKNPNTYRILLLGDSMTFGWGVEDNQTYSYFLEQEFKDYAELQRIDKEIEVINAGFTDGITLDSFYVFLKETGIEFDPDLIILNLFPYNDLTDLLEMSWEETDEKGYPVKIISTKEKVEDGYLVKRQKTNWKFEVPYLRNSHLAMLIFNALEKGAPQTVQKIRNILDVVEDQEGPLIEEHLRCLYALGSKSESKNCFPSFLKSFDKAKFLILGFKEFSREKDKKFLITIMPTPDQAFSLAKKKREKKTILTPQPQAYFKDFFKEEEIIFLDLLPTLSTKESENFFYLRDGHLNKQGNQEVAGAIFDFLEQNYSEELFSVLP